MATTAEQAATESANSEIFAYSGIECRLTVSQSGAGYTATAYCPYCGKGVGNGRSDANEETAVSQAKARFQDHLGHCPVRNAERPPLGVTSTSPGRRA